MHQYQTLPNRSEQSAVLVQEVSLFDPFQA